jgi:hypothetical protein
MTDPVVVLPQAPGLGRHIEHDPRSRAHDQAPRLTSRALVTPTIWERHTGPLNQGPLGACTGFAMTGWLACAPHCTSPIQALRFDHQLALWLYNTATWLDPFVGHHPPDDTGSSGNAVAKAARQLGEIASWGWCFTTDALLRTLMTTPVIVGVPWYQSMFTPDHDGIVRAEGELVGGHEFLIRGWDGEVLICDNSWGPHWGHAGSFYLTLDTWAYLRANRADVTVPHI